MQKHIEQMLEWIDMESVAQARQLNERRRQSGSGAAEKTGDTLLDMAVADSRPGLAGANIVTFVKRNRERGLPVNRFRVGTPVMATGNSAETEIARGVVIAKEPRSIKVSLPFIPDGTKFRLDVQADEVTRKRQSEVLSGLKDTSGRFGQLRDVLLGLRTPEFVDVPYENDQLNLAQVKAVRHSLSARDLAIIHGPPGTGKTTTVVEIIKASVGQGQKVLATAPSNTAVDNLLEKLVSAGLKVVRLGHPARVDQQLTQYTLDAQVSRDETMEIVKDMRRESEQYFRKAGRYTRSQPPRGAKQDMYNEGKRLRQDARLLEKTVVDWVIGRADVICSTNSLNTQLLSDIRFDLAVIDEACQCTEPSCWVPLQIADKLILAGDHCQLPPTVVCPKAAKQGFDVSLLERVNDLYGAQVTIRLTKQYRMNSKIMQFSSDQFYEGSLEADASVAEHLLKGLDGVTSGELTDTPVQFIDTAGADWEEELEEPGESRQNSEEASLVVKKIESLIGQNVPANCIAVITPYAAQARLIRRLCEVDGVEVDTVDGFQGREKEVVIISCVRCNREGAIGFLGDTRRMNVALTRAKRKLIVIGDSATLANHEFYSDLLRYFEKIDAYSTVWNEM